MTTDFDSVDYFTDPSLVPDPHPYFDHMRSKCPVAKEPHHGVIAVTGWEEANNVYRDAENMGEFNRSMQHRVVGASVAAVQRLRRASSSRGPCAVCC